MKKSLTMLPIILLTVLLTLTSCGKTLYEFAKKSERGKASLTEKSVQIDDHRIVYLEAGEGETILLIHGFGGDKDNWTRFAKYLVKGYHVIAPDLPGFGESSRSEKARYDIESQTERVKKFADALGLKKFHLAGNSMGGWISAAYASKYKEQVMTLTLLNAAGVNAPVKSEMIESVERGYNPLLVTDVKDYDRLMNFVFVKPPYIPCSIKREFAAKAVKYREFNNKIFSDLTERSSTLEKSLPRITAPSLIIWGDTDRVLHVSGAGVFKEGIKNSRSYILKECGHIPMIERPEETARVFLEFIASGR